MTGGASDIGSGRDTTSSRARSDDDWALEDKVDGVLARGAVLANAEETRSILSDVSFCLPGDLVTDELVAYAQRRDTPLDIALTPDTAAFDFHLVELPLNILVPPPKKLVRIRLRVSMNIVEGSGKAAAYDLYPKDDWTQVSHDFGEFSIDVPKALSFVAPAPVAQALGLNLKIPFRWNAKRARVKTTDRMSNPVEWYVKDTAMAEAFVGYLIVRSPKRAAVTLAAQLE